MEKQLINVEKPTFVMEKLFWSQQGWLTNVIIAKYQVDLSKKGFISILIKLIAN